MNKTLPKLRRKLGVKLVPVDYEPGDRRDADMLSLIKRLERTGQLPTVMPLRMLRVRKLYVRNLMSKREACKEVGIPMPVFERWNLANGWDMLRSKREFELYQRVSKIRQRAIPDIDAKHDQMFHNLESLIEDTIHRIQRDEVELTPTDLKGLAAAARACMDARRIIQKKEGPADRRVIELKESGVFQDFAASLLGLINPPKQITEEEIKTIPFTMEDQEHEDEKDAI